VLTGKEIDHLIAEANPAFKAMILLGINTAMGPADIGRLRWDMIDLERGRLNFPRPKTGTPRVGCLWRRTREALLRVRSLKHNRLALEREGAHALVFVTRTGRPFYRERQLHRTVVVDGKLIKKLAGIAVENAISITFGRIARSLEMQGVTFYRLRHSFRTYAAKARDREIVDLCMGHTDATTSHTYDHSEVPWRRVRRVSKIVRHRLWPELKQKGGTRQQSLRLKFAGDDSEDSEAA
jgi:integrase